MTMATRQALVAVKDAFEGPWQRARGFERAIIVKNLGQGERIVMESESESKVGTQIELPFVIEFDGRYPFPRCDRFRFVKTSGGVSESSVMVEI